MKTIADILAKAAAIKASPQFFAKVRESRAAKKPTAKRQPTLPNAAKPEPIELDNGDRLMGALKHWQTLKTAAHQLTRVSSRNLTPAELRFIDAVRRLPSKAPNASSNLREWRHFAKQVEAAELVVLR
jgi:hypothetical protein